MHQQNWNLQKIKQFELETGQAMLLDEHLLVSSNNDFGGIVTGKASALFKPSNAASLQALCQYATYHKLPLTIRGKGLSQSGQSLAPLGSVVVDVSDLNSKVAWVDDKLIAGCGASWKDIILKALEKNSLPFVFPYNTELTLGGVLSAGGLGCASFKEGTIASHITGMTVITAAGNKVWCNKEILPELFESCLSGVGLFGIIYEAEIKVRPCKKRVQLHSFNYNNYEKWINDQVKLKKHCDYMESYVSDEPSKNGNKTCIITVGIEYNDKLPTLHFIDDLHYDEQTPVEDKPLLEYTNRHDSRIKMLRDTGAWHDLHPWYECTVDSKSLIKYLDEIVNILDATIGGIYHVFPVEKKHPKYFMLPKADHVVTFNILSPGFKQTDILRVMNALQKVDNILQSIGAKRYISGWFNNTDLVYWKKHYGSEFTKRQQSKRMFDPLNIFCSQLFPNIL